MAPGTPNRRPSARKELMAGITVDRLTYLYVTCGLSIYKIAQRYGVSEPAIRGRMQLLGIPTRPKGRRDL